MPKKTESLRAAGAFFERLRSDEALRDRAFGAASYAEFLKIARAEGFDLSGLAEAEARSLAAGGAERAPELSEEELRTVAGGVSLSFAKVEVKYTEQNADGAGGGGGGGGYGGPVIVW